MKLSISTEPADLAFVRMVLEEEARQNGALPFETLMVLTALREARRMSTAELASQLQCSGVQAVKLIEPLVESGLIQAQGTGRGRQYTLSPKVYRELGQSVEYTRQVGFDNLQQVEMIRNYVREEGRIKREDVARLCRLTLRQATYRLAQMEKAGQIQRHGENRGSYYTLPTP